MAPNAGVLAAPNAGVLAPKAVGVAPNAGVEAAPNGAGVAPPNGELDCPKAGVLAGLPNRPPVVAPKAAAVWPKLPPNAGVEAAPKAGELACSIQNRFTGAAVKIQGGSGKSEKEYFVDLIAQIACCRNSTHTPTSGSAI